MVRRRGANGASAPSIQGKRAFILKSKIERIMFYKNSVTTKCFCVLQYKGTYTFCIKFDQNLLEGGTQKNLK